MALALSAVGTLGLLVAGGSLADAPQGSGRQAFGIALAGVGAIAGPSLGHLYAGQRGRAWSGIGLRVLGLAIMGAGAAMGQGTGRSWSDDGEMGRLAGSLAVSGVGLAVWAVSAVHDIKAAPGSADLTNDRVARDVRVGLTRLPGGGGSALAARVAF